MGCGRRRAREGRRCLSSVHRNSHLFSARSKSSLSLSSFLVLQEGLLKTFAQPITQSLRRVAEAVCKRTSQSRARTFLPHTHSLRHVSTRMLTRDHLHAHSVFDSERSGCIQQCDCTFPRRPLDPPYVLRCWIVITLAHSIR